MPSLPTLSGARNILRRSRFLQKWRFVGYILPYRIFARLAKVRPQRTLFLSDSHADFTGNLQCLRDELASQAPNAEIRGIFKPGLRTRRPIKDLLSLPWLMATAQTIVLDDFYPLVYALPIRPDTRLLQVWHAGGAFKKVGYSRAGLPGGPTNATISHRNYTDVTVSSEAVRGNFAEAFGVPIDRVHALGVPRTDSFLDPSTVAQAAERVRARYGIAADKRIVLYAPTFRGNGQLTATFDYDCADWSELAEQLHDWTILIKMHPFVTPLAEARPGASGIVDVTADGDINELLMAADVLVTDYSSAIFDYSLLRRPIVFFCPDLPDYAADRSFYYPFERYAAGQVVTAPRESAASELAAAIRTARYDDKQQDFTDFFMGACDGHSAERIVREVILTPRGEKPETEPPTTVVDLLTPANQQPQATRAAGNVTRNVILATGVRLVLNALYAPLRLLPRRREVLMLSREHKRVPADFADLARAIGRLDPSTKVTMSVRMVPESTAGKIGYVAYLARQLYQVARCRVLVVDTYAMAASMLRHGPGLTVVQIWHALGAFKKFGLSILDTAEGRDARLARAMRMHEGYSVVLASGEACRPAFAEAFGVDVEKVRVAPLPRVDRLLDPAAAQATRERIFAARPEWRGERIAVFAPTLRLDDPVPVDLPALAQALQAVGYRLVVKQHPLVPAGVDVDTAPGFSTQDVLQVADVFVTDYSSALYEAALLGLPCYFLAPDIDSYATSRDFYLDVRTELPGPVVRGVAELASAIAAGEGTRERAAAFARRWVQVPSGDGGSSATTSATPCTDHIARMLIEAAGRS